MGLKPFGLFGVNQSAHDQRLAAVARTVVSRELSRNV
jgi:hypothetical protein